MPKQNNATDVNVKKLEIRGASGRYDLTPHMQELSIYEDIFRPALTATMVLVDSHNVPYKLPIVGEETVDIDIALTGYGDGKDSEAFSIKPPPMHVNSLSARSILNPNQPKAQRFSLDLVSETYMSSLHSKVSKSYNNDKISDIVSDIYYNYLYDDKQGLTAEPTERTERVIIPNLSPFDAIAWLSKRAVPSESNGVNYVYYETMRGSFFISLNSLVVKPSIFTFIYRARIDDPTGVENASAGILKIKDYKFIKQFDKQQNTKRGVYASKLITHDIVRKKITQFEYGGFNEWFAFNHCGDFPPLSNSEVETRSSQVVRTSHAPSSEDNAYPTTDERNLNNMVDSRVEFYPKHNQMYAQNTGDLYDNKVEDWKLRRNGHIGIYDGISILLEVAGNSALRVGQTVTVILPSPETTSKDKKSDTADDKFLSGKYMVTAIQHIFSRGKEKVAYNMKVEVTKDGLEEFVDSRKSRKED
jgi:hypothetical protein